MNETELWTEAFNLMLSKGDAYSYDFKAAISALTDAGFTITKTPKIEDNEVK